MLSTLVVLLLITASIADHPVNFERDISNLPTSYITNELSRQTEYRLPQDVVPLDYDVDIDLNFEENTERSAFSYVGRVAIIIQAVEPNVTQIVLHANVDNIDSVDLWDSDGSLVSLNIIQPIAIEPIYHFLRINLAGTLELGANYTLAIEYSSTMNEGPLKRGIWWGQYIDASGNRRLYATTHFQPYNARQAFPCWDEPLFKAVFHIHLTHPANYPAVFSNTRVESMEFLENGRIKENFLATPKMSSYLVTFLVSESFQVIAEDTSFDPPVRIIGRSNTAGLGDYALKLAVGMTSYFEEYFGIPYASLHENLQNDHISSPDWASAGTENWGMVSYRELYMIIDPQETIMSVEHYAATLISHELAHKWFGNLITCYWWSNTWINEGFASYFGYIATSEVFPEYAHDEHINSRYLQTSLTFDSGTGTVPLNHEVNTPAQVTGHFGTVSYSKGAAFLRMISDMITPETFRKACQYFLTDNAYEPTYPVDLYEAFERAITEDGTLNEYTNFNFTDFYYTWVNEAGSPLLNVDINYESGEISLSQERFFLSASATPTGQIYPIPITYSTESSPEFMAVKPFFMMTSATDVVSTEPGEKWIIFNNLQRGHYRVNYNERNWELISEALMDNLENIHYLNRAQIVDDVYALMRSEKLTWNLGFRVLRFLRNESSFFVWDPAITMFNWLRNRLRHVPDSEELFTSFVLSTMEYAIEQVGYEPQVDETPTTSMNRQSLLHFACLLGHQRCVQESRERFLALRDDDVWVHPSIRRNVYVVGIREGDETDYEFLLNRYLNSNFANDQLEMLRALAATKHTELVNRFLQMTLTDNVRTQDKVNAFNYVLLGNFENGYVALQFLKDNIEAIREIYQEDAPNNPVHTIFSNLPAYLDEAGLEEFEDWLRNEQSTSAQYATGISAIASARNNLAWGTSNADVIISATRDGAAQIVVSVTLLTILAVLAMIA